MEEGQGGTYFTGHLDALYAQMAAWPIYVQQAIGPASLKFAFFSAE